MQHNVVETVLGAVVIAVAGGFLAFAYQSASLKSVEGYDIKAKFQNVDGLGSGSDVRIGGIKVGVIAGLDLDPATYQAVATIQLREGVEVPTDSTARVSSDGLLGGKYVAIEPGAEEEMLKSGGEIEFTQSSVSIESLIGKFMHSGGGVNDEAKAAAPAAAASDMPAEGEAAPAVTPTTPAVE
jgi:phospholipid/cholesterol/gamma-HCH transport system substrate-binding protein